MIPKKAAPNLIRGVKRFSEKIMLHEDSSALPKIRKTNTPAKA